MKTYISILRGINVGGKRKILMQDLKELYQNLGFRNPVTYIHSGNIIFETDIERTQITEKIEKAILKKYVFEVPVIIRTREELLKIRLSNPFIQSEKDKLELLNNLHFTFLGDIPTAENIEEAKEVEASINDKFEVIGNNIFIFCEGKYHTSKLTNNFFEKKLQTKATTRNWKTIEKLVGLMQ